VRAEPRVAQGSADASVISLGTQVRDTSMPSPSFSVFFVCPTLRISGAVAWRDACVFQQAA
jgi:hypothetical protein